MIEQALAALIASGLPGIFCVVFLFAIGYLYRSKEKAEAAARDAHLEDLRSIAKLTETVKTQLATTQIAIQSLMDFVQRGEK